MLGVHMISLIIPIGVILEVDMRMKEDFELGIESTSHIESIWSQINGEIKEIYYIIPAKKFFLFVREVEYKIKTLKLNNTQKISNFFSCFKTVENVDEKYYDNVDGQFLNLLFNNGNTMIQKTVMKILKYDLYYFIHYQN